MADPMHFDARADDYARFRPPYPDALWQRLVDLDVLRVGHRVLDLGAGTGEATAPLAEHGARVTAVEPGAALAARLRQRVPSAEVVEETAETVSLPTGAYDLAVVATAVHWFNLDVVLPRLHRWLVPGGHLAVWRTVYGDPEVRTPFRERVGEIVAQRPPRPARRRGVDPCELTGGGLFAPAYAEVFRWSIELDSAQVRGLFGTFSDWTSAEVDAASRAVDELGGTVVEHYLTPLVVLERTTAGS